MPDLSVLRQSKVFTILASNTVTDTSAGTAAVQLPPILNAVYFLLDVTAQATTSGDTFDCQVQTNIGGTWVDVVAFTQVLGNGSARKYMSDAVLAGAAEGQFNPASGLAADAVRNIIGDEWRVTYDITDETTDDASFTFSIVASIQ